MLHFQAAGAEHSCVLRIVQLTTGSAVPAAPAAGVPATVLITVLATVLVGAVARWLLVRRRRARAQAEAPVATSLEARSLEGRGPGAVRAVPRRLRAGDRALTVLPGRPLTPEAAGGGRDGGDSGWDDDFADLRMAADDVDDDENAGDRADPDHDGHRRDVYVVPADADDDPSFIAPTLRPSLLHSTATPLVAQPAPQPADASAVPSEPLSASPAAAPKREPEPLVERRQRRDRLEPAWLTAPGSPNASPAATVSSPGTPVTPVPTPSSAEVGPPPIVAPAAVLAARVGVPAQSSPPLAPMPLPTSVPPPAAKPAAKPPAKASPPKPPVAKAPVAKAPVAKAPAAKAPAKAPVRRAASKRQQTRLAAFQERVTTTSGRIQLAEAVAEEAVGLVSADTAAVVVRSIQGARVLGGHPGSAASPELWGVRTLAALLARPDAVRLVLDGDPLAGGGRTALLTAPIPAGGRSVGVLVCRRLAARGFTVAEEDALLRLARICGDRLHRTPERVSVAAVTIDRATGLGGQGLLRHDLTSALQARPEHDLPVALVVAQIEGLAELRARRGLAAADATLAHIAAHVGRVLRVGDLLYRSSADELAVLLPVTDAEGGRAVANRLMGLDLSTDAPSGDATATEPGVLGLRAAAVSVEGELDGVLLEVARGLRVVQRSTIE